MRVPTPGAFQQFYGRCAHPAWLMTPNGALLCANAALLAAAGREGEAAPALDGLFDAATQQRFANIAARLRDSRADETITAVLARQDGERPALTASLRAIEERGDVVALFAEARASASQSVDRAAYNALLDEHQRFKELLENTPDGFYVYRRHPDGSFEYPYFNSKFYEILGLQPEHIRADPHVVLSPAHEEDRERVKAEIQHGVETMSPIEIQHRINHVTRGVRTVLARSNTFCQDDVVVRVGCMRDITEQLALEERSAQARKELAHAHHRLTSITNAAPIGIYEFRLDPNGEAEAV